MWRQWAGISLVFALLLVFTELSRTSPGSNPASVSESPAASPASPEEAYAARQPFYRAVEILGQGRAREAQRLLLDFLEKNPNDAVVPHAQYWLGQSYLISGEYAAAGTVFTEAFERDSTSPMAPDILRGLATALALLKSPELACATFAKLEADFPNEAGQIDGLRQQQALTGCR